ncbi:MAG: prolipoprotein diacylglyceryl transferase [Clostridia bacterium]|nr:prolipoprotein diacylglyceryl transferase [Clostridia bacterium]
MDTVHSAYYFWMLGSALITAGVQFLLAKGMKKRGLLCGLTLVLGTVIGVICARLFSAAAQFEYTLADGVMETLLSDDVGQLSYYGGLTGVCFGVAQAARLTGNRPMAALNAYAPAGALMAALARFGEVFLGMRCAGNLVMTEKLCFFPVAIRNEWDEWYVAVFMLAGLAYLIVFAFSLLKYREKRFVRTLFYLCLPQILLESLRNQSIIWHEFVRMEQLACMVAMEVILVLYGVWAKGQRKRFLPAVAGLACAGVFVAVEFALDKTDLPHLVTYAVMALGLVCLGWMECLGFGNVKKAGRA